MNHFPPLRLHHIWLLFAILLMMGCDACKTILEPIAQNIPSRFVLATTHGNHPGFIETRISTDGQSWSGPNYPRTSSGTRVTAHHQIAPGIGTNTQEYMLVWFDPNGALHSRTSNNGMNWKSDKNYGTYQVSINSKPSVAYHYTDQEWWVAFREGNDIVVRQLLANGSGASTRISSLDIQLSVAFIWTTDGFNIVYRNANQDLFMLSSEDGVNWDDAPGTAIKDDFGIALKSKGSPELSYSLGNMRLGTTESFTASQGFEAGRAHVYKMKSDGSWQVEHSMERINFDSRGIAIAGPTDNLVVAAANHDHTAMWWKSQELDPIASGTELEPDLSHGPAGTAEVYNVEVRFSTFKRIPPQGNWNHDDQEDVSLAVKHYTEDGFLLKEIPARHLEDMLKRTTNQWSNPPDQVDYPVFQTLLQPHEYIEVTVTGDSGPISARMTTETVERAAPSFFVGELPQDDASYELKNTYSMSRIE